jgi:tight adherence protein C
MITSNIFVDISILILAALAIGVVLGRLQATRRSRQNLALGYERRFGVVRRIKYEVSEFDTFVLNSTPMSIRESLIAKLRFVGKQGDVFLVAQLKQKYGWLLIGLAFAFILMALSPSTGAFGFLLAIGLFFVPDLRLAEQIKARQVQIGNLLPDALDQLTLLVDSGLDFQTAFVRVCRNSSGSLNDEFQRTLADLQLGITRKEAFENLGIRTGSPVLKNFARAMVLADLFGVPISNVLRSQAQDLRNARRARAEEEAQKIPTKITFPLVACLLPVILILLVGPSIMNLLATFK